MIVGPQSIILGDETFSHTHDVEKGVHTFENDAGLYRFREWTWGQKNAATNASVVFANTDGFRIETARFNEALLAASVIEATQDGQTIEADPLALRKLKASLGDKLLSLAQWVNGIGDERERRADLRFDPKAETYHLALGEAKYVLREWTWGEKNDISSRSVIYDPLTNGFRVDIATFNELMLEATLVEAPFEVTLDNLRSLSASVGDTLLDAAQRINGLTAMEKKRS